MKVSIKINRSLINEALMRTTGYIGAKQISADADAYERISLNEGDRKLLSRFWQESREGLCMALRRLIDTESCTDEEYQIDLRLSDSFDTSLAATLQSGITNYFVQSMAAKWLAITDKSQAAEYASEAGATLEDISRKAYCKTRPKRPTYN